MDVWLFLISFPQYAIEVVCAYGLLWLIKLHTLYHSLGRIQWIIQGF